MVHSKSAPISLEFLAGVAKKAGATAEQREILNANTASQVGEMLQETKHFLKHYVTIAATMHWIIQKEN